MFELVRAYEIARSEKNKFLRYFYLKYTKKKLKTYFFNKFDIENMTLNKDLLDEFFHVYQLIDLREQGEIDLLQVNREYPHIDLVDPNSQYMNLMYYGFDIVIKKIDDDDFIVSILRTPKDANTITLHPNTEVLNLMIFRPIILMTIYNYCVAYIYGSNSNLYIDDKRYIQRLYDFYR